MTWTASTQNGVPACLPAAGHEQAQLVLGAASVVSDPARRTP